MKVQLDRLRRLNLEASMANVELAVEHQRIADAIAHRDERDGMAAVHIHSHRILTDTERLRVDFPDYFSS